jgi:hypothetical protein
MAGNEVSHMIINLSNKREEAIDKIRALGIEKYCSVVSF